jgi:hypothetical protein
MTPAQPSHISIEVSSTGRLPSQRTGETMKKLAIVVGVVAALLVLFVLTARVVGFDPGITRPGMWLKGTHVTEPVTDWSFAVNAPPRGATDLESRQWFLPILAHSVRISRFHNKGRLYILSAYPAGIELPEGRHWNRNILANPNVRLRIDGKLYDRKLVFVTDRSEYDDLMRSAGPLFWSPGMHFQVWRVEPR